MSRGVLEQALDAMPAAVAVLDQTGTVVFANERWRALSPAGGLRDALREAERQAADRAFNGVQSVTSGLLPLFEMTYSSKTGFSKQGFSKPEDESRWFEIRATRVPEPDGHVVVIHADITERKQEQERLRASEANYREIFDKANDGVFIHDIETGQMLDANYKLYEMYGYTAEEFKAIKVEAISANRPPYTQMDALKWMQRAAKERSQLFEWLAKDRNGRLFWVEVNLKRARIAGQDRLLAIVRDVTERKRAEDETQRLRRALSHVSHLSTLGEVGASLAHELNQPLAAIMTNTQAGLKMLSGQAPEERPDELREILADIASDDERAAAIVRRMREPLNSGRLAMRPLELNGLVEDIRSLLKTDALLTGTHLDLYLAPDLPPICGDRIQLQQVIMNLVVNGIEATRSLPNGRRKVTIITRRENGSFLRIQVDDSGLGIAEGEQEAIFEPFWTTKADGLGLGLAICRTLVEAHGGTIHAGNRPEGGARFVVMLPVAAGSLEGGCE